MSYLYIMSIYRRFEKPKLIHEAVIKTMLPAGDNGAPVLPTWRMMLHWLRTRHYHFSAHSARVASVAARGKACMYWRAGMYRQLGQFDGITFRK